MLIAAFSLPVWGRYLLIWAGRSTVTIPWCSNSIATLCAFTLNAWESTAYDSYGNCTHSLRHSPVLCLSHVTTCMKGISLTAVPLPGCTITTVIKLLCCFILNKETRTLHFNIDGYHSWRSHSNSRVDCDITIFQKLWTAGFSTWLDGQSWWSCSVVCLPDWLISSKIPVR